MKYYLPDPPRERIESIEKSPQDYYPIAKEMNNEKNESETSKRKYKKNPSKTDPTAMAKVQK
jgi:hypothetical protein